VRNLVLKKNNFGNEGAICISNCIGNVKKLDLENCKITKIGAKKLSLALTQREQPVYSFEIITLSAFTVIEQLITFQYVMKQLIMFQRTNGTCYLFLT